MSLVEIVALVVAAIASVTKFAGLNKEFWEKVPALAHYVPAGLVVAATVGEKLAGVQTQNDLVNALAALGLLAYGHFSKPKAPPAPPAA
jgi:uncharacterized membrane protein YebE (DUF533 family)